jgi:hypothetical protein
MQKENDISGNLLFIFFCLIKVLRRLSTVDYSRIGHFPRIILSIPNCNLSVYKISEIMLFEF